MSKHFGKVDSTCDAPGLTSGEGALSEPWVIYNTSKSSGSKFRVLYKTDGSLNTNNTFYGQGSENEFAGCGS